MLVSHLGAIPGSILRNDPWHSLGIIYGIGDHLTSHIVLLILKL